MDTVGVRWRGAFTNAELNPLHADTFGHGGFNDDWESQAQAHSLGWVTARDSVGLVGFVNVPWDGRVHAWLQDVIVASRVQRTGVGTEMVALATDRARAAGCEWLHVDFDAEHAPFYFGSCGFTRTEAGLIRL